MAEFKLGRIRFVWKNNWTTGTTYVKDDIVRNGGKTYLCVAGHVANANFYTDLANSPTRWNQVSDGSQWKSDWATATYYKINDLVKFGGRLYLCNLAHTSNALASSGTSPETTAGLEADQSKWDLYATSFDFKGDWVAATRYKANDVVRFGGISYVCNTGHTSSATLSTDSDGLEQDQSKWDVYAKGFDWKGDWVTTTRYKKNDVVRYGGTTYVCNTGHAAAATDTLGLEQDQGLWDYFHKGLVYLGTWSPSSVRYKVNDLVKYGADLWICVDDHTSDTLFAEGNWSLFVGGLEFESSWTDSDVYQPGDVVSYGGYAYVSKTNNTNKKPTANPSDWDVFTTGFSFQGDWADATDYKIGQVLRLNGYTYIALQDHTSNTATNIPPNLTYWSRLNSGIKWAATDQAFAGIAGTNIVSNGSGATFDITTTKTTYVVTIHGANPGTGYAVGNTIKILGSDVGGITPANDITVTVATITGGGGTGPIATVTAAGFAVSWKSGVSYVLGDAVAYGITSYICVLAHTASSGNRPDADITGTYWNLLASGAATSVLTTQGDTVYMGGQGPTRLPIGTDGQVLRVTGSTPSWSYFGVINNVVYVAMTGADVTGNGQGLTIDKPWKTVHYAARQIEDGYLNPNASLLIAKNKQFLVKEIQNFVQYTYTVSVSSASTSLFTAVSTANLYVGMAISFTGTTGGVTAGTTYYVFDIPAGGTTFGITNTVSGPRRTLIAESGAMTGAYVYSASKTERDAGIIIDAVNFDLSHSGTLQITTAALAYFTAAGTNFIPGVYAYDITAFVGALNYLKTLIGKVLANNAPVINYQTLNSVALANQSTQIFDPTLSAEATTATTASSLISIVTTSLTAGTASAIPAVINPGTTISVKTGTFSEVLPIVVPKNTAVVGDELRSSVIQPATANLALVNDKPKTISVLNRIKALVPNIVTNTTVTPTAGNTASQVYLGFAGTTATATVTANTTTLADIVANGLGVVPAFSLTDPTSGTGNAFDAGYFNARRLIVANKTMIQDEVVAYMTANFGALWTSLGAPGQANCTRDIGYIVDALRYDLTYGGNLETCVAARSYYSYGQFVEDSNEKTAALAVQAYVKTFIDNIALGTTGWGKLTATAQDTSGTPGSADAAAFAQARIQDVYDTINSGSEPTVIAPISTWAGIGLNSAFTAVQARRAQIQASAIAWVNTTYPALTYNQDTCSRDVGYIVDALSYDLMFNTNFRSIKAGMAYYRATTSAQYVLANQLAESVGVVNYIGSIVKQITTGITGDVGSTAATGSILDSTAVMTTILANTLTAVPAFTFTNPTGYNVGFLAGYGDGKAQIVQNYAFIKDEVASYLNVNYNSIWVALGAPGQASCTQDVGYILDALQYDMTYGGNTQTLIAGSAYFSNATLTIAGTEKTATLAAYTWLKDFIDNIVIKDTAGWTKNSALTQVVTGTAGSAGAATFAQDRIQDIIDWITNGIAPTTILPTAAIALASTALQNGYNALQTAKSEIQADTVGYVKKYFPLIDFNTTTCSRDTGYIVDALGYDLVFGTNFNSVKAAMAYYRNTASAQVVVNSQLAAEIGSINFIGQKAKRIAAYGSSAQTVTTIDDMILTIAGTFTGTATATAVGGNITVTSTAGLMAGMPITFNNSLGGISVKQPYWILAVVDATTITVKSSFTGVSAITLSNTSGSATYTAGGTVEYTGTNAYNNVATTINGAEILRANKTFLANEATAWINANFGGTVTTTTASNGRLTTSAPHNLTVGDPVVFSGASLGGIIIGTIYYVLAVPTTSTFTLTSAQGSSTLFNINDGSAGSMGVSYNFIVAEQQDNLTRYIDALVYDLCYLGNYKSLRAMELYNNLVNGSTLSNMFLLRNGTGLRNMTLTGLNGTLGPANIYGTRRPTAGAYSSLDPGYGPTDSNVWITPRSPYTQNVSLFGNGCVGMKIDSSLHAGGNKSIVANDYTTIISDGIGVWCIGSNALTELVSVFAYYSYAGYLAENGGKMRATNGNNSYGTYGSLAEGVDVYETPITATVNNRYNQAEIGLALTDGTDSIYRFEYTNAGSKYTNATYSLGGTGYNASVVANEFRDNAVFETRLLTNGANYASITNVAQGGNAFNITLAATDAAISAAYVGVRVLITAGSGKGQAGYITTYNSGTKLAIVAKESFAAKSITAAGSSLLTVDDTSALYNNMPVMLTGTLLTGMATIALNTIYYVIGSTITSTQFSVAASSGGSTPVAVGTASSGGPLTLNAIGWDHIVPGTAIASALDLTTAYIIEPRVTFSSPTYTPTAITQASNAWVDMVYGDTVTTYNGVASAGVAVTGGAGSNATFTVIRAGTNYTVTVNNAGTAYKLNDVLTIAGTLVGGIAPGNNITITVNNVNPSTGAILNFTYDGTGTGGYYVAIIGSSVTTQVSSNGTTFSAGGAIANSTWVALAYGGGRWVAISASGVTNYTSDPTTAWTAGGALPVGSTWTSICYGNGVFMATGTGAISAYSTNGTSWFSTSAMPSSTTWTGVAYGGGVYVAIASGGTAAAISTDGQSWVAKTLPAPATWSSVTFGKNIFVAVASGSRNTAHSKDGLTWVSSIAGMPVSQAWSEVRYGQGLFFAVATGSTAIAATSENGIDWTSRTLSVPASWTAIGLGNPSNNPIWVALTASTTVANSIVVGCTAQARVKVSNGAISEVRMIEPGSGYVAAPSMTITDPNVTLAASYSVRRGVGALANPTFTNRGLQYATATATVTGNGYGDSYQLGYYLNVAGLPSNPTAGSNIQLALNGNYYKLVQVGNFLGTGGGQSPYTARFQLSPAFTATNTPDHGTAITVRLKYSQVRLTGHDFLSIGTGGVVTTNYPNTPSQAPDPTKETVGNGGGRVFYTSTDQDGNFRVGTLFSVEQATGVASINADAFNLAGLNSLTLGSVALGGSGATITSFSTDQYFTANSDNIVPTQKAIKSYITSQIGGGSSALNVNTLTAGVIYIAGNSISTTTGVQINVTATMNFTGGINGMPVAMDFLLLG